MRRVLPFALVLVLLGTSCPMQWEEIAVPIAYDQHDSTNDRARAIAIAKRVSLAAGLEASLAESPDCSPLWSGRWKEGTTATRRTVYVAVCVDSLAATEVRFRFSPATVRGIARLSRSDSVFLALRDSLAPLGGVHRVRSRAR
jgi:hypothetical protein